MNKNETDRLLRLIARGDNQAFEKLYIETKRGVYAFLYSYFGNTHTCEDAMQTVYLKIKTNISQYKPGTNGIAWILQIAKNTALNQLRADNNYQKLKTVDEKVHKDDFENSALKHSLIAAMNKVLTEEEKRIVILHVIWSYKHKEIAQLTDSPVGTVTSKYKRAVDKLKNELKEN